MDSLSACICTLEIHVLVVCLKAWKVTDSSPFAVVALSINKSLIMLLKLGFRPHGRAGISIALCRGAGEGAGD